MSSQFEVPDHFIDQLVDTDPTETAEWQESFDALLEAGRTSPRPLYRLTDHASRAR
jgi:pyruvate dehydrogenase complex dehydrogenase (E1) component